MVGNADGTVHGGSFSEGVYTSSADGDYISFTGTELALNTYNSITLEQYIQAGNGTNPGWTANAYFGGLTGSNAYFISVARGDNVTRTEYVGGGTVNGPELDDGKAHHIVSVLTSSNISLYIDGDLIGTALNTKPISEISTENAWLCRGGWTQWDPDWLGSFFEFNIYEGLMNPDTIKRKSDTFLFGGDATLSNLAISEGTVYPATFDKEVTSYGVILPVGTTSIDITPTPSVDGVTIEGGGTYDVSDGRGVIEIEITALNGTTTKTYKVTYTTEANDLTLEHSYTFEKGNANDMVGTAHAFEAGGQIRDGVYTSIVEGDDYLVLPAEAIAINTYPSITIEAMVTAGTKNSDVNTMLSYFGNKNPSNTFGYNYFYTAVANSNKSRTAISTLNNTSPWSAENGQDGAFIDDGKKHHVVSVLTYETIKWYIDGELIGEVSVSESNIIPNIGTELAYLCKGGYNDPTWLGSIHEFNIYSGVMEDEDINDRSFEFIYGPKTLADLTTLTFSEGIMTPAFDPKTTAYEVVLPLGSYLAEVYSETAHPLASIDGNGYYNLTSGHKTIEVIVTAADGTTTKTYTIDVTVQSEDDLATLAELTPDVGIIDPLFDPETTEYNLVLPAGTDSVDISAITRVEEAQVEGAGKFEVLDEGGSIVMVVTAKDGVTTKTYTINYEVNFGNYAMYLPGGDGNTSNIDISGLNLNSLPYTIEMWIKPDGSQNDVTGLFFHRGDDQQGVQYSSGWQGAGKLRFISDYDTDYGTVTGKAVSVDKWHHVAIVLTKETRTIYLDGEASQTEISNKSYDFSEGKLYIGWDSGADDRAFKGTIDEVRVWSAEKTAEELAANKYKVLEGVEESLVGYYNFDVQHSTLAIDNAAAENHGSITNGIYVPSFRRDDATLASLLVANAVLEPEFKPDTTTYFVALPSGSTSLTISATPNHVDATVAGEGIFEIADESGVKEIVVTAIDEETTKTYTINYEIISESSDATLASIDASEGTLMPEFSPAISSYKLVVPTNVQEVEITPTPNQESSTATGGGTIDLSDGGKAVTIVVTAEDGTLKTYTVNITLSDAVLRHSYTFENGTAEDMVGDIDGTMMGSFIEIVDGVCVVDGASTPDDGYITFDGEALALNTYSTITIEAMLEASDGQNVNSFTMLSYFGSNTAGQRCFWYQPTRSNANESRAEINNGTTTITAPRNVELDDAKPHHVAVILSADELLYYLDGKLVSSVETESNFIPEIATDVAYLFKGVWSDPNFNASLHEYNIYNGPLSADEIAERYNEFVSGPSSSDALLASLSTSVGDITPEFEMLTTDYQLTLPQGSTSVDLIATPNREEASVAGDGTIDLTDGSKTVDIVVTAEDGVTTKTYTIDIIIANTTLMHSYTFEDGTANDVIGQAHGTVNGGNITNGVYTAQTQGADYIELPADIIAINTYEELTFETFITAANGLNGNTNTMLSYFGNTTGDFGTDYIYTAVANGGKSRTAISCGNTTSPWSAEVGVDGVLLDDGAMHHIVTTITNKVLTFYINGEKVGETTLAEANKLGNLSNTFAYLCKSGYVNDPTWLGSIHEFNIYNGIMDASGVEERYNFFMSQPSADATLSAIESNIGEFDADFDAAVYTYTLTVPTGTSEVTITATATDENATIEGDGTIDLEEAGNTISIIVTAEDGTSTHTYTINVEEGQVATNTKLASLSADIGTLSPEFLAEVTDYSLTVPAGTASVNIEATAEDEEAVISGTGNIDVAEGNIEIIVSIGEDSTIYTIEIIEMFEPVTGETYWIQQKTSELVFGVREADRRLAITDANIINLTQQFKIVESHTAGQYFIISEEGEYLYHFDGWKLGYAADTAATSDDYRFTFAPASDGYVYIQAASKAATVYVGTDGTASGDGVFPDKAANDRAMWKLLTADEIGFNAEITLSESKQIEVEKGLKAYPLYISGINVVGNVTIELSAGFSATPASISAAELEAGAVLVEIDAPEAAIGTTGELVVFINDGATAVDTVEITAVDPYTRYFITQKVSNLVIGNNPDDEFIPRLQERGENDPSQHFMLKPVNPGTDDSIFYIVQDVEYRYFSKSTANTWDTQLGELAEGEWKITDEGEFFSLKNMAIDKYLATDGVNAGDRLYANKDLEGNENAEWLIQDISISLSDDATLSSINVTNGSFDEVFNPEKTSYTVTVPYGTSSIEISATPNDPAATVSGYGTIDLSSGDANVSIVVTAENGEKKTYNVLVKTEAGSDDATLAGLSSSVGTLSPGFSASVLAYTVVIPSNTTSVELTASANHEAATVAGDGTITISEDNTVAEVIVTAQDGSTQTYTVTFAYETGFTSTELGIIKVYPTVSNGLFNIEFSNNPGTISVFNLSGKLIKSKQAESLKEIIEIENAGTYLIKIESNGAYQITKVIKVD
ncbi:MAG: cadherin-like beta sandwich domain-containing protein [Prolixibacteraceae bacterium]|nr:cadherin-like beta sandwich domain-containing protein [Prolixibacteraceae bacterium]